MTHSRQSDWANTETLEIGSHHAHINTLDRNESAVYDEPIELMVIPSKPSLGQLVR